MLYKMMFNDNHTLSNDILVLMKKLKRKNSDLEEIKMYEKMSSLMSPQRLADMYGSQNNHLKNLITPEKRSKNKKSPKANKLFKNLISISKNENRGKSSNKDTKMSEPSYTGFIRTSKTSNFANLSPNNKKKKSSINI